jgi:hypothetical protein
LQRRALALLAVLSCVLTTGVATGAFPAAAAPAVVASSCSTGVQPGPASIGRVHGIARPKVTPGGCVRAAATAGPSGAVAVDPGAAPPLLFHGGKVMSTPSAGNQVIVTPIFWENPGFPFTAAYKNLITTYLADVAADSDTTTNVFSTMNQYSGSNGALNYRMTLGTPITDTTAYPAAGCTVNAGAIYADGTDYSTCLDDAQVSAETAAVQASHSLTRDLGHLYLMFLPQHVETCIEPGNSATQACSINSSPSGAFCAYHSGIGTPGQGLYYANMPFPVYSSATGFSCTDEGLGGGIQTPNGDTAGDVELSSLSHEMAEAITDPEGDAWFDAKGFENGDACAYVYGTLGGPAGAHFNQTINGHHYLTQEEFSNADWLPLTAPTHEPCLQTIAPVAPTVTGVAPASGAIAGGTSVTITGTGLTAAIAVSFGTTPATSYTVVGDTQVTAVAPAHAAGSADVTVTTPGRTSAAVSADSFTYVAAPTVSSVSPPSGPVGTSVTITGTDLATTSAVSFGGIAATFSVVDATHVSATAPTHAAGAVDVTVTTSGGTSAATGADLFTYLAAPTVTRIAPSSGPVTGGTTVTITGTAFRPGATVTVGGHAATAVVVVSATRITARAPAHIAGFVDVRVSTTGGVSPVVATDRYRYLPRPVLTGVTPSSGPRLGGRSVTLVGTGFTVGSVVRFGTTQARVVTLRSTRIVVVTPRHLKGRVPVSVTTPGGTSAARLSARYLYV